MAWTTKDWLGGVNHSHQTVFSNVLQVLPIVKQFDVLFFLFFTSNNFIKISKTYRTSCFQSPLVYFFYTFVHESFWYSVLIKICVLSCSDKRFITCITASVFFGDESCVCCLSPVFSVMNAVSYCID